MCRCAWVYVLYMCEYVCVNTCVCVRVCACVWMCVWMCVLFDNGDSLQQQKP